MNLHSSAPSPSFSAASRRRSLVRDACDCLQQEMFFWGCDASHQDGNLLTRYGMARIARSGLQGEGSSRYRMAWRKGTVELHSFCAGWYPHSGEGVLFIRNQDHLYSCSSREPLTPGIYEKEQHAAESADVLLQLCGPLLEWILEYESWMEAHLPSGYRHQCWLRLRSRLGGQPWLPPEKARDWCRRFLADPNTAPRARQLTSTHRKRSHAEHLHLPFQKPSPRIRNSKRTLSM